MGGMWSKALVLPRDDTGCQACCSPGGNVAEPSRLWMDHAQRQDAAATLSQRRSECGILAAA